ncbi:hypothetical protein BGX24_000503 [Mortierella sp. AD032]|nr:hypothetical protein BGX24_000503 [Mortierella sp. AD032]
MARGGGGYSGGGGGGGGGDGEISDTTWAIIGVLIAITVFYCIYVCYKKTCANPAATQDPEAPAATPHVQAVAAPGNAPTNYPVMTQQQQTYTPANNTYQQTTAYAPMTQAPAASSPYTPTSSYAPASPYPPSTPYTPTTPYAAPAAYPPSTGYPPMGQPAYGAPPAPVGGFVAQYPPQPQQPGQLGTTYL